MNVPRPDRGYWAKLAVGKAPQKPALPEVRPGDASAWSREGFEVSDTRALPKPPNAILETPVVTQRRQKGSQHPLLAGVKEVFEAGRLSYETGYLKPAKRNLVDLAVTKTGLDKALSFANDLFYVLENRGHRVMLAPNAEHFRRAEVDEREQPRKNLGYKNLWTPGRCTVVYVGTVAMGLTVIEMSEEAEARYVDGNYVRLSDHTPTKAKRHAPDIGWTTKRDFPTGRICLQAYSPYSTADWVRQWRETKHRDSSTLISTIVIDLETSAGEVADLVAEGERKAVLDRKRWEAEQARWRKEEAERQAAEALKESKDELIGIIGTWAQSKQIEAFLAEVAKHIEEEPADKREHLLERLRQAQSLLSDSDALGQLRAWKAPHER